MGRPQNTVRGTVSTNGQTTDLTAANLRTVISSDSGGGTTNFLRADGTWNAPGAGPGGLSDGDYGDITVSGGGSVMNLDAGCVTATELSANAVETAKIADDAVTWAKIQHTTDTARVIGRSSIGGGELQELTASTVLDFIGATRGTVLYRGASGWAVLAVGVDGQVLTTHGAGADPTWETASGGSGLSQAQVLARLSYGG